MEVATIDRSKEWTVDDYLQLEEGLLAQLIDGNLIMSPAPTTNHQRVLRKLYDFLSATLKGEIFFSPIDLYINEQNVLQPDLVYISESRNEIVTERGIEGTPDLVIEVISPSNSFIDRNTKRKKYLDLGVTEYWIVDPANQTLEIYTPMEYDTPKGYLIREGKVKSDVSDSIGFDLKSIF
ncbi:MAG: Uma2 family endonuclease [Ekhidna sp.]|uniref:Uma2 family endonuclease n=1 Tax=Ekhidna sp. TaxID=2608089 RepID=UPI0032EFA200